MARKFNDGRQNEVLMNEQHYNIYKLMQYYLSRPDDIKKGPQSLDDYDNIENGALWLDKYTNNGTADLKYFENGVWKLLFGNKFKLIIDILSPTEPENPIEGQLWINPSGMLTYYKNGQFIPIKSVLSDVEASNPYLYDDFLIIRSLTHTRAVLSNVSKFIFSNAPIEKYRIGKLYYYQQGVLDDNGNLYVCCQKHYFTNVDELFDTNYWLRVDTLIPYLVPNANYDKYFADEYFLHQKEEVRTGEIGKKEFRCLAATLQNEDNSRLHDCLKADVVNDPGYYDCLYATTDSTDTDNKDTPPKPVDESGLMPVATMSYEEDNIIHYPLGFDTESGGFYYQGKYYDYNDYKMILEIDDGSIYTGKKNTVIDLDNCYEKKNNDIDDPYEEKGYIPNTTTSIYVPENDLLRSLEDDHIPEFDIDYNEQKIMTAVHVNPIRINKINKYLIAIKDSNIIEISPENTEFYLVKNGYGKLLIENSEDGEIYDYCKCTINGSSCIRLSDKIMQKAKDIKNDYLYIYAVNYDFSNNVKTAGKLKRKKIFLNNSGRIYIGPQDIKNICVFAQGLYFQRDKYTYTYDYKTGYLQFKYKLLNSNKSTADLSIIRFPEVINGTITTSNYNEKNYIEGRGYKIDLNTIIGNQKHCIGFLSGLQCDFGKDYKFYPDDNFCVYFPNITKEYLKAHNGSIKWSIVKTDRFRDSKVVFEMYRGLTKATTIKNSNSKDIACIRISRDKALSSEEEPFLDYNETPIVFVDGLLIDQNDLVIEENYITIKDLKAGQKVLLLADSNKNISKDDLIVKTEVLFNKTKLDSEYAIREDGSDSKIVEDKAFVNNKFDGESYIYEDTRYEHNIYDFTKIIENNSDNILYQESISNMSINTESCDSILLYFEKGIKCDNCSVAFTEYPIHPVSNQICHIVNSNEDTWYIFNEDLGSWMPIPKFKDEEHKIPNPFYSDVVNTIGYTTYPKHAAILNGIQNQKYCTYFAYTYSDTIEEPLQTGYCYPDGKIGNNDDDNEFVLGPKHYYIPGKNELSVYLNGIKQNLDSYNSINFEKSTSRECNINESDKFALCYNDGSCLKASEGFFTYKISKHDDSYYKYNKNPLTDNEISQYQKDGYDVELISMPNKNIIFYVVERCESGESTACSKTILTYKDSLSSKGAFANNTYYNPKMDLCKGHVKVYINGLRQPFGSFKDKNNKDLQCYSIIDSHTIKFNNIMIGGINNNLGNNDDPKFPINVLQPNRTYEVMDEILVETRSDLSLRELTIPLMSGQVEFGAKDGLPDDLFKSKDFIMIYINGRAYGNNFKNNGKIITLNDFTINEAISFKETDNNFITFEWR